MDNDLKEFANILFAPSERDEYKRRIDKAIEYIEKVESVNKELKDSDMYWAYNTFFPELLDILKGSDKE